MKFMNYCKITRNYFLPEITFPEMFRIEIGKNRNMRAKSVIDRLIVLDDQVPCRARHGRLHTFFKNQIISLVPYD